MPAGFELEFPVNGSTLAVAKSFDLRWSPSGLDDPMELRADLKCVRRTETSTSTGFSNVHLPVVPDRGSITLNRRTFFVYDNEECDVDLELARVRREGSADTGLVAEARAVRRIAIKLRDLDR